MVKLPENIEKIDETEAYLLDDEGKRTKRICGKKKKDGSICLNEAGKNTSHFGVGPCNFHESAVAREKVSLWRDIREKYPEMMPTIGEALERTEEISKEKLTNIDNMVEINYALLLALLKQEENKIWSTKQSEHALFITNSIVKALKIKSEIEKTTHFEAKDIRLFVHQVFQVIVKTLDERIARKVMETIIEEVIMPMNKEQKGIDAAQKMMERFGVQKVDYDEDIS